MHTLSRDLRIIYEILADDDKDIIQVMQSGGFEFAITVEREREIWFKDTVTLSGHMCQSVVELLPMNRGKMWLKTNMQGI